MSTVWTVTYEFVEKQKKYKKALTSYYQYDIIIIETT